MRVLSFIMVFLIVSCKSASTSPVVSKIDLNSISNTEKQKVYEYGKKAILNCMAKKPVDPKSKSSKTAEPAASNGAADNCELLRKSGKFVDMELVEVIGSVDDKEFGKIFRYKGRFQKREFINEIRIWVTKEEKIDGIIWQEWKDEYEPYQK